MSELRVSLATTREGWAWVRSVFCPACQALEGESCTHPTDTGRREVGWVHFAREDAYHTQSATAE